MVHSPHTGTRTLWLYPGTDRSNGSCYQYRYCRSVALCTVLAFTTGLTGSSIFYDYVPGIQTRTQFKSFVRTRCSEESYHSHMHFSVLCWLLIEWVAPFLPVPLLFPCLLADVCTRASYVQYRRFDDAFVAYLYLYGHVYTMGWTTLPVAMLSPMVQLLHGSTEIQILMITSILVYTLCVSVFRENGNDAMLILKRLKISKYTFIN